MSVQVNTNGFERVPADVIQLAVEHALGDSLANAELSLTLVSDEEITSLNRDYLDRDRTTDVIAFSLGEEDSTLGDVYVCVPQAERQAREMNVELADELARLAIHGTLHVLGHDHPEGPERSDSPMFVLQERLLAEVLAQGA